MRGTKRVSNDITQDDDITIQDSTSDSVDDNLNGNYALILKDHNKIYHRLPKKLHYRDLWELPNSLER